ncbi:MAG: hypothetical protein HQK75_13325 [Candidatus Magnetomorum sp.]|nr:hypothetical protein [Candidatus Magnetomorum sp.]
MPANPINSTLRKVIQMCHEMLEIADHGDKYREDKGCGIVYGLLRDNAYKIRQLAEKEIKAHQKKFKKNTV